MIFHSYVSLPEGMLRYNLVGKFGTVAVPRNVLFSSPPSNGRNKIQEEMCSYVSKQEDCFVLLWILQHMFREKLCPLWNYRLYRRCTRQIVGTVTETKRIRVREECQDSDRVIFITVLVRKSPVWRVPSGYVKIAIENDHRNSGFSHETWWFSIAILT